jgi:hypothetical protein
MLVLGFDGSKSYNSGSGIGSPTIIRLGLWEDQVVLVLSVSHVTWPSEMTEMV